MVSAGFLRRVGQAITALSAGAIAYATLTPGLTSGGVNDTLAHFLMFLPLGFGAAVWLAPMPAEVQRRALPLLILVLMLFAGLTELAQGQIDGRSATVADWMADVAGGVTGLVAGGMLSVRARRLD